MSGSRAPSKRRQRLALTLPSFVLWGDGLDLSSCPYYRGEGKCESGCYSEPSCITDRPLKGWPSERTRHTRSSQQGGQA